MMSVMSSTIERTTDLMEGKERLELGPEAPHILSVDKHDDLARQVEQLDAVEGESEVRLEVWEVNA